MEREDDVEKGCKRERATFNNWTWSAMAGESRKRSCVAIMIKMTLMTSTQQPSTSQKLSAGRALKTLSMTRKFKHSNKVPDKVDMRYTDKMKLAIFS